MTRHTGKTNLFLDTLTLFDENSLPSYQQRVPTVLSFCIFNFHHFSQIRKLNYCYNNDHTKKNYNYETPSHFNALTCQCKSSRSRSLHSSHQNRVGVLPTIIELKRFCIIMEFDLIQIVLQSRNVIKSEKAHQSSENVMRPTFRVCVI